MFSSPGGWLFEDVAGLGQARAASPSYDPADPSAHGFRHAVIFPRVTDHPALPFAQGEYDSVAGRFAVAWANANASAGGGTCVADAPENAPVHFACPAGGTITGVAFASFGTPTGSCGAGFSRSSCDAANSSAIVRAACVGQSACDVDVSTTVFGDPCYDVVKHLDAQVTCSSGGVAVTLAVTVPANAKATVRVPFSSAGAAPGTVTVTEGGAPVWAAGAYVPGVPGVTGASVGPAADTPVGQFTIDVEVGSGDYAFAGATR